MTILIHANSLTETMDLTELLDRVGDADGKAAEELIPIVYEELRRLAQQRLINEVSDISLQATALVHEAYLRLVDTQEPQNWDSLGHFFSAAAIAMRRILVERARQKKSQKHGGGYRRLDVEANELELMERSEDLIALDEALQELEVNDPQACRLVMLRYFGGLGHQEAAEAMGIGRRAADRLWSIARVWLREQILDGRCSAACDSLNLDSADARYPNVSH